MKLDLTKLFEQSEGPGDFAAFSTIYEASTPGNYLCVLVEGEVSVSIKGTDV